jgi:hypothetical protein
MVDRPVAASAVGKWIRAVVRNDNVAMRRLGEQFPDEDLDPVVDAVFSLAVRRRFSQALPTGDITRQMLGIRQRYGASRVRPLLEMEMVVRRELGERVPIDDLDDSTVSKIKIFVFEQIVHDLALFDDELDELIVLAESHAAQQGT